MAEPSLQPPVKPNFVSQITENFLGMVLDLGSYPIAALKNSLVIRPESALSG